MNSRVVITGVGLVTPLGIGTAATWEALCRGRSGVGPITRFDARGYETRFAAEVKDFRPADFLPRKTAARVHLFIAFACAATRLALEDARLEIDGEIGARTGVAMGCGLGGLSLLEDTGRVLDAHGPRRVSPFFVPMMIGNMAPGMISILFGARGPNLSFSTACAAGTHAVGEAVETIRRGGAEAMIAGGVEAVVSPLCIAGFNAMKALSTRNEDPARASRPFDRDRDGFVVGEGAGVLVLERLDRARRRGARIYAEVAGYATSSDAHHVTQPAPEGRGAVDCMRAALENAGIAPETIDHINAHGTGTPLNDVMETRAIRTVFGPHAGRVPVSATKSMTGHLLGGAGGVETVFTALAIHYGVLPPTINLDHPDPECDLDHVAGEARRQPVRTALTNSFGFGGTNACLVLRALEGG